MQKVIPGIPRSLFRKTESWVVMKPDELPETIAAKVHEWMGANYAVVHFWNCGDTYLIVARSSLGDLYFLRVFPIGGEIAVSQDGKLEVT